MRRDGHETHAAVADRWRPARGCGGAVDRDAGDQQLDLAVELLASGMARGANPVVAGWRLSLIHISEPTRPY